MVSLTATLRLGSQDLVDVRVGILDNGSFLKLESLFQG